MLKVIVSIGLLLFAAADAGGGIGEDGEYKPVKVEHAPYEIDPDSEGKPYEKRLYPAQKWVSTVVTSHTMDGSKSMAFMRLFWYISGKNERKESIKMTVPVLRRVSLPNPLGFRLRSFKTFFYIPNIHQADPPKPSNPNVNIEEIGPVIVYAKKFPGYNNEYRSMKEYNELKEMLQKDNVTFDDSFLMTAGYDSPIKTEDRRNEVWLMEDPK